MKKLDHATSYDPNSEASRIELPEKLHFLLEMHRYKVAYGGRGSAKCLALGTRVIMHDGSLRAVEDVAVGENVRGPDNKPRRVLATSRGNGPLYRVEQTSGMTYVVNDTHVLSVKKSESAKREKRVMPSGNPRSPNGRYPRYSDVTNISVGGYAAQPKRWREHFRGYRAGCLSFPAQPVLVDPYFLGVWLGDGTGRELRVTSMDAEIIDYCRSLAQSYGGDISIGGKPGNKAKDVGFNVKAGRVNPIWQGFKSYGLPNNKHIPQAYLSNSEETRLQLLAGLLDTDGSCTRNGYLIVQVNERLARDIKFLADGLGFRTSINKRSTICTNNGVRGAAWAVGINGDTWRVPCLLPRKQVRKDDVRKNKDFHLSQLTVTPHGVGDWAGFTIDGDHLFCLEDGTVTHNSWSFADALLALGGAQRLRVLCVREVQKSIKDSVHKLLSDRIRDLRLDNFYTILENEIRGANGTEIIFAGLANQTSDSIKSFEGVDICWAEEAQNISKRSWMILIPTIRAPNSEIWVSFNPDMDTDDTWTRFIENPPPGAVVVRMNWIDNPWFPEVLESERLHCKRTAPEDYDNIWEGKCRSVVAGAIYARELSNAIEEGRIRSIPYDPRLPVHTIWDLGWNDAMAIIMVQKPIPQVINVINYMEDSFRTYAEFVEDLRALRYSWGTDWLPHDSLQKSPVAGISAFQMLRSLGRKPKLISTGPLNVEEGIKAARMLFPRVYIDNSVRKRSTGHLGAARLIECLKRYRRNIPRTTEEPSTPVHDIYSHGGDAWRGLATVAERIRNENDVERPLMPGFVNREPSMGLLG